MKSVHFMKITIHAVLYAPSYFQFIGGTNHPVFRGTFVQGIGDEELRQLVNHSTVRVGSEVLDKRSALSRTLCIHCEGNLTSLTREHFERLQSKGWKLNPKAAKSYRFPDDEADKSLNEHCEKQNVRLWLIQELKKRSARLCMDKQSPFTKKRVKDMMRSARFT
jgi:hypothetical protein